VRARRFVWTVLGNRPVRVDDGQDTQPGSPERDLRLLDGCVSDVTCLMRPFGQSFRCSRASNSAMRASRFGQPVEQPCDVAFGVPVVRQVASAAEFLFDVVEALGVDHTAALTFGRRLLPDHGGSFRELLSTSMAGPVRIEGISLQSCTSLSHTCSNSVDFHKTDSRTNTRSLERPRAEQGSVGP